MSSLSAEELERAFQYLEEARKILFQQLHHSRARSRKLVEGIDKLAAAFELAESPEKLSYICPNCESLATEKRENCVFRCFSCDEVWVSPHK